MTNTNSMTRKQRRTELALAQQLSREGNHDAARALFAKHGISYCCTVVN